MGNKLIALQGRLTIDNGAQGTEKLLLITQISKYFELWDENYNIIYCKIKIDSLSTSNPGINVEIKCIAEKESVLKEINSNLSQA